MATKMSEFKPADLSFINCSEFVDEISRERMGEQAIEMTREERWIKKGVKNDLGL